MLRKLFLDRFSAKACLIAAGMLAMLAATGCQTTKSGESSFAMPTFNMPKIAVPKVSMPSMQALNPMNLFKSEKTAKKTTPSRMAVIWKDASISDVGKPTTRGVGGRVYFYDENNEPVAVEGELVVYGYNNAEDNLNSNADRKYVFEQKDIEKHYSETDIGPSYSFWVPWDKAGGMRQTIGLVPVFKDKSGHVIQGGHSLCVLNGKSPIEETVARTDDEFSTQYNNRFATKSASQNSLVGNSNNSTFAGAQVNHTEVANASQMRTSTIRVPRSMAQRMKSASAAESALLEANSKYNVNAGQSVSPLVAQLQSQNQLDANQSVSYGPQPTSVNENGDVSETNSTAETTTERSKPVSPFAKERPSVFGRPGAYR